MNKITRFSRARRAPARRRPWRLALLAFVGSMVFAQLGIWQYREFAASPAEAAAPAMPRTAGSGDSERASFTFCHAGGGTNCVVDGDTIYYRGTKIRIADIDTPETHEPRCPQEAALGKQATQRMHALVNSGPFSLESIDRDEDRFGRKLRILTRGGQSLGGILVDEGLARWYQGGRRPWC
ncbi:MAG: thermonuclease family protein [Pseudomonadota bacterium]